MIGITFKASKVTMRIWPLAMYFIAGSKKGLSSNQLHRVLSVTLKTGCCMCYHIRWAMRNADMSMFGGFGAVVQQDEIYIRQHVV